MDRQGEIQTELRAHGLRMEASLSVYDDVGHALIDIATDECVDPVGPHVIALAMEWSVLESPDLGPPTC